MTDGSGPTGTGTRTDPGTGGGTRAGTAADAGTDAATGPGGDADAATGLAGRVATLRRASDPLVTMLAWDVRLQYRYGFYGVYAVVTVLFVLALSVVPPSARDAFLVAVVFSDPGFLGFYFVAALVLFERREGVLDALVTSPLSAWAYLVSKAVSLTLLATAGATVVVVAVRGTAFDPLALALGIGLTAPLFALVGFVAVARFDSLNAYFLTAIAYTTPLALPLLDTFGIATSPLFYLLPTQASVILLEAAVTPGTTPTWEFAYAVGYLLVATAVAAVAAHRAFVRHVVRDTGGPPDESPAARPDLSGRQDRSRAASSPVASLVLADARVWVRDPLLLYIGVSPFLLAALGRWGVPALDAAVDFVDLAGFGPVILALFALAPAATFGFVAGVFVLEDRDQGVLTALRATPLTGRGYLAYRGVVFVGLTALVTLLVIPFVGLATLPPVLVVAVAAVAALHAAVAGLLMAALAANTVEGVAVSKLLGFLVIAPAVAVAFVPFPLEVLAGVFPPYWVVKAVVVGVSDGVIAAAPWLTVGAAYQGAVAFVLARRFLRRAD